MDVRRARRAVSPSGRTLRVSRRGLGPARGVSLWVAVSPGDGSGNHRGAGAGPLGISRRARSRDSGARDDGCLEPHLAARFRPDRGAEVELPCFEFPDSGQGSCLHGVRGLRIHDRFGRVGAPGSVRGAASRLAAAAHRSRARPHGDLLFLRRVLGGEPRRRRGARRPARPPARAGARRDGSDRDLRRDHPRVSLSRARRRSVERRRVRRARRPRGLGTVGTGGAGRDRPSFGHSQHDGAAVHGASALPRDERGRVVPSDARRSHRLEEGSLARDGASGRDLERVCPLGQLRQDPGGVSLHRFRLPRACRRRLVRAAAQGAGHREVSGAGISGHTAALRRPDARRGRDDCCGPALAGDDRIWPCARGLAGLRSRRQEASECPSAGASAASGGTE